MGLYGTQQLCLWCGQGDMDLKELLESDVWNMEFVGKVAVLWLLFSLCSQSVLAKGLEISSCLRKVRNFS